MLNKQWYNKKEILELYPISTATYKKRIKDIDPTKTKFITSKSGSPTRYIHYSVLDDLFRKRRRLSKKEYEQTIKWVRNHYWNYFGNIVPVTSSIDDLKFKMRSLFEELKKLQMEKNHLNLFYSIEKNTSDEYYHAHFLIDCAKDMIELEDIMPLLEIICDPNTSKETRIHLKEYDMRYDKAGAIYNSKNISYYYELLS
jgi:regulator of replication initiation timing